MTTREQALAAFRIFTAGDVLMRRYAESTYMATLYDEELIQAVGRLSKVLDSVRPTIGTDAYNAGQGEVPAITARRLSEALNPLLDLFDRLAPDDSKLSAARGLARKAVRAVEAA